MNFPSLIRLLFSVYTIFLFARIALSWVPSLQSTQGARFIAFYTDPYLNLFKKILPPLGGQLDLSPLLAFFVLRIVESAILGLFR